MKNRLPLKGSLLLASFLALNAHANETLPMPSIYGNFDLSLAVEIADEMAFALEDAVGDSNFIGVRGHIPLSNGNQVNYVHEEIMTIVDGASFAGSYQTYLGYQTDKGEVRAGNLDLPLKKVMDKADLFSGTYADLNSIVLPNTTANSAVMYLSGNDEFNYAVSLDTGQATAENANNDDAIKYLRMGAMGDMTLSDSLSLGFGFEHSEFSTDIGIVAEMVAGDSLVLNASLSRSDRDANAPLTFTLGGYTRIGDDARFKAQLGMQDPDANGQDDALLFALGYDKRIAKNLTAYALLGIGDSGGINPTNTSLENESDGAAKVLAVGVNFSF